MEKVSSNAVTMEEVTLKIEDYRCKEEDSTPMDLSGINLYGARTYDVERTATYTSTSSYSASYPAPPTKLENIEVTEQAATKILVNLRSMEQSFESRLDSLKATEQAAEKIMANLRSMEQSFAARLENFKAVEKAVSKEDGRNTGLEQMLMKTLISNQKLIEDGISKRLDNLEGLTAEAQKRVDHPKKKKKSKSKKKKGNKSGMIADDGKGMEVDSAKIEDDEKDEEGKRTLSRVETIFKKRVEGFVKIAPDRVCKLDSLDEQSIQQVKDMFEPMGSEVDLLPESSAVALRFKKKKAVASFLKLQAMEGTMDKIRIGSCEATLSLIKPGEEETHCCNDLSGEMAQRPQKDCKTPKRTHSGRMWRIIKDCIDEDEEDKSDAVKSSKKPKMDEEEYYSDEEYTVTTEEYNEAVHQVTEKLKETKIRVTRSKKKEMIHELCRQMTSEKYSKKKEEITCTEDGAKI